MKCFQNLVRGVFERESKYTTQNGSALIRILLIIGVFIGVSFITYKIIHPNLLTMSVRQETENTPAPIPSAKNPPLPQDEEVKNDFGETSIINVQTIKCLGTDRKYSYVKQSVCSATRKFWTSILGFFPTDPDEIIKCLGSDGKFSFVSRKTCEDTNNFWSTHTPGLACAIPTVPGTLAVINNGNTPTWSWPASTAQCGFSTYNVQWSQDLNFVNNVNSAFVYTNAFTHSSPLADGTWYFKVKAVDMTGNSSNYSSIGSTLIDTTVPTVSSSEIGNVNNTTVAVTFSETIAATGDDYLSGITIKVDNVAATINSATRQANHAIVYYVISSSVIYGDVITIAYSSTTGKITDTNGVALATFNAQSVTNSLSDPTLIADAFTDTNGTAIASHTIAPTNVPATSWRVEAGTWSTQNGKVNKTATSGTHETISVDAGQANAVVEAYIQIGAGGGAPGVVGRLTDNTHWIGARLTGTTFDLFQRNTSFTQLKQTAFTATTTDTYRVRLTFSGTTVTATVNEGHTLTDTVTFNQTATRFGLWSDQTAPIFDNFRVGNGSLPQLGLLVIDGNSLTSGFGATAGLDYPSQTVAGLTQVWQLYNFGVGGQTTTQMSSDASTQIDALYNLGRPKNIVVPWEITNELYFGTSESDAYNNYVTYCQARRAAGFKVIAVTVLPRSNVGTPAGFETARQTANTAIRSNWTTFADALADVAADSRIGDAGDELDTTYYDADQVHMNATGYGVVAGIAKTAIESIH